MGPIGHAEQHELVVVTGQLVPGPCGDGRYVISLQFESAAAAGECSGSRAMTMTEMAVSRAGRVWVPGDIPSSRQARVARAGPPVTGFRYSSLVTGLCREARAISR